VQLKYTDSFGRLTELVSCSGGQLATDGPSSSDIFYAIAPWASRVVLGLRLMAGYKAIGSESMARAAVFLRLDRNSRVVVFGESRL
jgi:hypothetical protein